MNINNYNNGGSSDKINEKTYLLNNKVYFNNNNKNQDGANGGQFNFIVLNRDGDNNNQFPTTIPNELISLFTPTEYSLLIKKINNFKPPSQSFYLILIIIQMIIFITSIGFSFYFLTISKKLVGLALLLLFFSILSLISTSFTFFKKSNDFVDEMKDFYIKLSKSYDIKRISFHGKFKKTYSKLGQGFYKFENSHVIIEFPKILVEQQTIPLFNINNKDKITIKTIPTTNSTLCQISTLQHEQQPQTTIQQSILKI